MNPQIQKKVFHVQALMKYNILLENNNANVDKGKKKEDGLDAMSKTRIMKH